MIKIKKFIVNPIEENTYIVSDETGEAVIIDCGCFDEFEWEEINSYLQKNELTPVHLLNTHAHFDHILGNRFAFKEYGLKTEMHEADIPLYQNLNLQINMFFGQAFANEDLLTPLGTTLKNGDTIKFGNCELAVLHTPGHSPGGICFYSEKEKQLFSGDTLFKCSVGRTDLQGGNFEQLSVSIKSKLSKLDSETTVYPGHGPSTTIGFEKLNNPYIR